MQQVSFASVAYTQKKKQTRRERFLTEMDAVLPWPELLRVVRRHYPKAGRGRHPIPLERMLRIYFLQQWYGLSDPAMEDALYDIESLRRFAGIELNEDAIPDETTICKFRHLLETHNLTAKLFTVTEKYLSERGLLLREGTIVDATIIDAPASTKNAPRARDPEMAQTKKGNMWYFGMKAHVGCDTKRGLTHSIVVTDAAVHDSQVMDELLHGEERAVYGDKAYASAARHEAYASQGIAWRVSRKAHRGKALTARDRQWNRRHNRVRAKGEHAFQVVKHLWGYKKVRYKGLAKNAAQVFTLFALANVYLARRELLAQGT